MIHYKASDLLLLAMKLADLENTAFISSEENRSYINNAWAEIYQQAIDNGELFYLNSTTLHKGENNLPEDFHQVYNIKDDNWNPLPKYNKDMKKSDVYYKIMNNKIYISGKDTVEMEYFPAPVTLDLEGEGDVELDFPNNIYKQLLVLRLAEYYKIRQNGDISGIELLIEDAWKQFYDMLNRDANQYGVIQDVYSTNNIVRNI
jgi:hypothetical protein